MAAVALEARYAGGLLAGLNALQFAVRVRSISAPARGLLRADVETAGGPLEVELIEEEGGACTLRPPEGRRGLVLLLALSKQQADPARAGPTGLTGLCGCLRQAVLSPQEIAGMREASGLGVFKVPKGGSKTATPGHFGELLRLV